MSRRQHSPSVPPHRLPNSTGMARAPRLWRRGAATTIVLALTGLAGGCAGTPSTEQPSPPVDVQQAFSDSGQAERPDRWWTAFDDRTLNTLIERALDSNLTLRTAWQRLREAEAVVDRESASLFPDLTGTAQARAEAGDAEAVSGDGQLRLGLTSEYEVDLWGRIGSAVEAERYRAQATLADYRTAALSVAAEVARTWYQLVEAHNQLDLVSRQIGTNEKVLQLIKARFGTGQTRSADILRQQELLESTREQRHITQSRIRTLEHQLAVLLGHPPQSELEYEAGAFPALPPLPETGLPAALVRRRPDTRSAFHRLQAADRDVAAAISNQFPRLTLTASVTSAENGADDLFRDWASAFTGELVAPLLDAGRRAAEVARTRAVEQQRLYEYGQTMLTAFREVEDALIQERKQRDRIASLREQFRLARQTYTQLRQEYMNGVGGYLDVLTALADVQSLRRDLLTAERQLVEFRIALYRALAGGFRTDRESRLSGAPSSSMGQREPRRGADRLDE